MNFLFCLIITKENRYLMYIFVTSFRSRKTRRFLLEDTTYSIRWNGSITGCSYEPTRKKKRRNHYQRYHHLHSSLGDSPFLPLLCPSSSLINIGVQLSSSQHALLLSQCFLRRYCKFTATKIFGKMHMCLSNSTYRLLWWTHLCK